MSYSHLREVRSAFSQTLAYVGDIRQKITMCWTHDVYRTVSLSFFPVTCPCHRHLSQLSVFSWRMHFRSCPLDCTVPALIQESRVGRLLFLFLAYCIAVPFCWQVVFLWQSAIFFFLPSFLYFIFHSSAIVGTFYSLLWNTPRHASLFFFSV